MHFWYRRAKFCPRFLYYFSYDNKTSQKSYSDKGYCTVLHVLTFNHQCNIAYPAIFSKDIILKNFFYSYFNSCFPPLKANCSIIQPELEPSNFPEYLQCDPDFIADMFSTLDLSKSSRPDGISPCTIFKVNCS